MDDDQQFCLRWNNHQSTLISVFDTLLENETLVDCTLAAEGKFLKAHKVVLSACSPYFATLLQEQYDKHPIFILKDVKYQELRAMMDYMYRGEVNISQDQLAALLKAAESLQIKGLSDNRSGGGSSSAPKPEHHRGLNVPGSSGGKLGGYTLEQTQSKRARVGPSSMETQDMSGSREGSSSPSRRRRKTRRRSIENAMADVHDNSNSSQIQANQASLQQQQSNASLGGVGAITAVTSALASQMPVSGAALPTGASGTAAVGASIASTQGTTQQLTTNVTKKTESVKGTSDAMNTENVQVAGGAIGGDDQSMEHVKGEKQNHKQKSLTVSAAAGSASGKETTEMVIEPKSEYDEEGNEETVEDLTLDDEEMGMEDLDQNAGTSQGGEGSSQGYAPWQHDRSQDELLLATQEAQQRDPQGYLLPTYASTRTNNTIISTTTNNNKNNSNAITSTTITNTTTITTTTTASTITANSNNSFCTRTITRPPTVPSSLSSTATTATTPPPLTLPLPPPPPTSILTATATTLAISNNNNSCSQHSSIEHHLQHNHQQQQQQQQHLHHHHMHHSHLHSSSSNHNNSATTMSNFVGSATSVFGAQCPLFDSFVSPPGEENYECPQCFRTYRRHGTLRRHLRQECGKGKSMVCSVCGHRTKRADHLRQHVRKKHPEVAMRSLFRRPAVEAAMGGGGVDVVGRRQTQHAPSLSPTSSTRTSSLLQQQLQESAAAAAAAAATVAMNFNAAAHFMSVGADEVVDLDADDDDDVAAATAHDADDDDEVVTSSGVGTLKLMHKNNAQSVAEQQQMPKVVAASATVLMEEGDDHDHDADDDNDNGASASVGDYYQQQMHQQALQQLQQQFQQQQQEQQRKGQDFCARDVMDDEKFDFKY